MKIYGNQTEPTEEVVDEQETSEASPDELLAKGQQICELGKSIVAAAQSMGAKAGMEEEEEMPEEEASEEESDEPMPQGKNAAIILAIKKKMGQK